MPGLSLRGFHRKDTAKSTLQKDLPRSANEWHETAPRPTTTSLLSILQSKRENWPSTHVTLQTSVCQFLSTNAEQTL